VSFGLRELAQTFRKPDLKAFLGPLPLPLLYLVSNAGLIARTMRVYFNVTALHANRSTQGPNDLQPVTSAKVEVGLARHVLALRRARKILLEIPYLTPYPTGPLPHPFQNVHLGCGHRSHNLDGSVG
jgi:hypothetical protein